VPTNWAKIEAGDVDKVLRLYDAIEELDDVRETYVNVEFPDDMVGDD
jgi:transcriptional/translational regulatory protein YebC/TACO1